MRFPSVIVAVFLSTVFAAAYEPFTGPFQAAYLKAQAQVPDGQLIQGRVEKKPKGTVYGFYFWKKGVIHEVEIFGGEIEKQTTDETDPVSADIAALIAKKNKAKAKLPEGRIFELAGAALKDTDFPGIQYKNQDGKLVAVVGNLVIDTETGKVISP